MNWLSVFTGTSCTLPAHIGPQTQDQVASYFRKYWISCHHFKIERVNHLDFWLHLKNKDPVKTRLVFLYVRAQLGLSSESPSHCVQISSCFESLPCSLHSFTKSAWAGQTPEFATPALDPLCHIKNEETKAHGGCPRQQSQGIAERVHYTVASIQLCSFKVFTEGLYPGLNWA